MAKNTDITLRQQIIYSIYIRNHTAEGTFRAAIKDMGRIREQGADIVWLMPIHPIGVKNHKGSLGCPYAISDYRRVNPEYGTMEDFQALVEEIHRQGMKCMIDVVYNHTSPDSWLAQNRPEYFYRRADGSMGTKTGDWTDVADLDYGKRALWDYQIETLCLWAKLVDGFRCDVASLVPLPFWKAAREAVEKVHPGFLWLAETVEPGFIQENRKYGHTGNSDGEMFEAFDICYDYDVNGFFLDYLKGKVSLKEYVRLLNVQDAFYPENYVKLRFLENHDQTRAAFKFPGESDLKNWTAFLYFQKGAVLLYGGQETENRETPSLFDEDKVDWNTGKCLTPFLKRLYEIKKLPHFLEAGYELGCDEGGETIIGRYVGKEEILAGFFCTHSQAANIKADLWEIPDGRYENLIDGEEISVKNGLLALHGVPVIIRVKKEQKRKI